MVVLARSALAGALLATASLANPAHQEVETKLTRKDVDTRYPYNGPTVVIGLSLHPLFDCSEAHNI